MVFGPYDYVEKLDATFEQYCDGASVPARGEVHVTNRPAPPVLTVDVDVDVAGVGTVDVAAGRATLHGTVSCNKAAYVTVEVRVSQTRRFGGDLRRGTRGVVMVVG